MELGSGGKRGKWTTAVWYGNKAAKFGNFSKPSNTPEVAKGVENRSCGSRFLCIWSNTMRVTFLLNAGQAGASLCILLFSYPHRLKGSMCLWWGL